MLEEAWVRKYIKIDFERFEYRVKLMEVDWPMESLTQEENRQRMRRK